MGACGALAEAIPSQTDPASRILPVGAHGLVWLEWLHKLLLELKAQLGLRGWELLLGCSLVL